MRIKVLDAQVSKVAKRDGKGTYEVCEVKYTNIDTEKQGSYKIVGFGPNASVFETFKDAKEDDCFDVTVKKEGNYFNWVAVEAMSGAPIPAKASGATPAPRSNFETPDERAMRQVYIARQSSLDRALEIQKQENPKGGHVDRLQLIKDAEYLVDYIMNGVNVDIPEVEVE